MIDSHDDQVLSGLISNLSVLHDLWLTLSPTSLFNSLSCNISSFPDDAVDRQKLDKLFSQLLKASLEQFIF